MGESIQMESLVFLCFIAGGENTAIARRNVRAHARHCLQTWSRWRRSGKRSCTEDESLRKHDNVLIAVGKTCALHTSALESLCEQFVTPKTFTTFICAWRAWQLRPLLLNKNLLRKHKLKPRRCGEALVVCAVVLLPASSVPAKKTV
jgi:hypothetical protein